MFRLQEQAIAVWDQASCERAAGRVPSIANFQTLLSAAQAQREGPATPEQGEEPATVRIDSGGLRRCAPNQLPRCPRSPCLCVRSLLRHAPVIYFRPSVQ